jgi:hypothetical protein
VTKSYHLGKEKNFDIECYAISEAIRIVATRSDSEEFKKVMVISNSTIVIKMVHHTKPGPGQRITIKMVEHNNNLFSKGIQVKY